MGLALVLIVLPGCTVTKLRLTGTTGTYYSGYYMMELDREQTKVTQRKLPDVYRDFALSVSRKVRLKECEFRKEDTNAVLQLQVRTPGFRGIVISPPGTDGVRVSREGKKYVAQAF